MREERKLLGNITFYATQQVEKDPAREAMRQALRKQWRRERAKRDAVKHLARMTGNYDPFRDILFFCDAKGRLPENLYIEDMERQYRVLWGRLRWVEAIVAELHARLEYLDAGRYRREQTEKAETMQALQGERDRSYEEYMKERGDEEPLLKPKVREAIRAALRRQQNVLEMKHKLGATEMNSHLLGVRQVERMLHYLFADHIVDEKLKVPEDTALQYKAILGGLEELEVIAAEIDQKLYDFRELVDSARAYIDAETS